MKNRQFIVLCLLIIVWFIILYIKLDKNSDYLWNIDHNVVNVDNYLHKNFEKIL